MDYLDYVVSRILGASARRIWRLVCLLPGDFDPRQFGTSLFYFGGTSLLIVVSASRWTSITQVQSHMLAHQYEGLIEKSKLRGKQRGREEKGRLDDEYHFAWPAGGGERDPGAHKLVDDSEAWCSFPPGTCCARPGHRGPRWASRWPRSWTAGSLVTDEIVIGLIAEQAGRRPSARRGSSLTASPGHSPRRTHWMLCLRQTGKTLDAVVEMQIADDEELVQAECHRAVRLVRTAARSIMTITNPIAALLVKCSCLWGNRVQAPRRMTTPRQPASTRLMAYYKEDLAPHWVLLPRMAP